MKKCIFVMAIIFFPVLCCGDYKSDAALGEANFSVGNYWEALQYYKRSYKQKPDELIGKYIDFITKKLKNNPKLVKKSKNPVTSLPGKPAASAGSGEIPDPDAFLTAKAETPAAAMNAEKPWAAADNLASFTVYFGFYQSPSFYARYERTLFPGGSLAAKIGVNSYLFNGYIWQGKGGGLEYRHFFQGRAPNAWFIGTSAEVYSLSAVTPFFLFTPTPAAAAFQLNVFAGYRWIFDFGMSFDTALGAGYVPYGSISDFYGYKYTYGGFVPALASNVGYAW